MCSSCQKELYFSQDSTTPIADTLTVHVLVLNYDPYVKDAAGIKIRIHEYYHWDNPHELVTNYAKAINEASGGYIRFVITNIKDIDAFPIKEDGFTYTAETYKSCWQANSGFHMPDGADYVKIVQDNNVAALINNRTIDEVWLWGGPYFGYWESAMAGPQSFNINGGTYPQVNTNRAFAIMGFNYERGLAEMLHSNCHRTEATMAKVYGGWQVDQLNTTWAKFAANATQSNGIAAVGSCHYPPNAKADYDYANPAPVMSSADDWLNYPYLTGVKKNVSSETWGGPDYHLNYMKWWYAHLPKKKGADTQGKLLNWWRYIYDFNETILK
ncbi:MAG: hypothetical protein RL172_1233 [Bacteroidota bacterium]|jgi:hypothetical protein